MGNRYRRCGVFLPQFDRYDAEQLLLPLILSDGDWQSEGYFLLSDPMQQTLLQQTSQAFEAYLDVEEADIVLYLAADDLFYPVGIGAIPLTLDEAQGQSSGFGGYGLELV